MRLVGLAAKQLLAMWYRGRCIQIGNVVLLKDTWRRVARDIILLTDK